MGNIVVVKNIEKNKGGEISFEINDKAYKLSRDSEISKILIDLLQKPEEPKEEVGFFGKLFGAKPKVQPIKAKPVALNKAEKLATLLQLNGSIKITYADGLNIEKKTSESIAALKYTLSKIDTENIAEEVRDAVDPKKVNGFCDKLKTAASQKADPVELQRLALEDSVALKILVANNLNTPEKTVLDLLDQGYAIKVSPAPSTILESKTTVSQSLIETIMDNVTDDNMIGKLKEDLNIANIEISSQKKLTANDLFRRLQLGTFEQATNRICKEHLLEKNEDGISLGKLLAKQNKLDDLLPLLDNQVMCSTSGQDRETLVHDLARYGRFTAFRDALTDDCLMQKNDHGWSPVLMGAMTRNLHQISDKLTESMLFAQNNQGMSAVDLMTEDLLSLPEGLKEKVITHKSIVGESVDEAVEETEEEGLKV